MHLSPTSKLGYLSFKNASIHDQLYKLLMKCSQIMLIFSYTFTSMIRKHFKTSFYEKAVSEIS